MTGAGRTGPVAECYRYLDALNTRHGRRSIQLASAGVGGPDRTWTMKQELKTPNYTTCWKDLPRARA